MTVNFLDSLSKDQRDMLVSLPYRVGLRISQSDDTGGDESDAKEAQALDNLLTAFSQEIFGAETVQYIIGETVKRKTEWPQWAKNMNTVEDDCNHAIDLLSAVVDAKEVSAFKSYLIEIGESVALAFREYGDKIPFFQRLAIYNAYNRSKKHAEQTKKRVKTYEEFLNISLQERKALQSIAHALGAVYI